MGKHGEEGFVSIETRKWRTFIENRRRYLIN